ncbi:hypothetical protein TNCV_4062741 [Trichonephila clavipes]|nr:hypothetical protein TNCV_4062741 [Trichonephila clavipes]
MRVDFTTRAALLIRTFLNDSDTFAPRASPPFPFRKTPESPTHPESWGKGFECMRALKPFTYAMIGNSSIFYPVDTGIKHTSN